jgi:hypothetical protein
MLRAQMILSATALTLLSGCATALQPGTWDAVAAAPKGHQVLLENDSIRVLRVSIEPGGLEPIHEHGWPSVMYFEQPQPITYIVYQLRDGTPVEVERVEAPALPAGHVETIGPEGLHAIQNRGVEPFLAVRVEFKKGDPTK